jgi:hypothetical protein
VDTAFVTIPGHIYAAFDAGIGDGPAFAADGEGAAFFAARQNDMIAQGGRLWIPVEITVPGEGFFTAWRIGAREWRSAATTDGEGRRLYPMRESWAAYPPVTVPEAGAILPDMPEERALARRLTEALQRR